MFSFYPFADGPVDFYVCIKADEQGMLSVFYQGKILCSLFLEYTSFSVSSNSSIMKYACSSSFLCADKPSSAPHTPRGVKIVPASSQNTPQSVLSGSQPLSQGTPTASASNQSNLSTSQLSGIEEMGDDFDDDDMALQGIDDAALQEMQS